MGTKVFALRIGEKFGQDVEDYINSKIPNVTWIRDELDGVRLQWNKMRVMNMDNDEPVVVIDLSNRTRTISFSKILVERYRKI